MDFYTLYNITPAPLLDKTTVKKKYLELSRNHHPDFADSTNEEGMQAALELSSSINHAYKIFNNTSLSIQYYLQYKHVIAADEKFPLPPNFLMDMMEINEELEDAKACKDEDAIEAIKMKIEATEAALLVEVDSILTNHQDETIDSKSLDLLKAYYYKKKYIHRILEGIS